MILLLEERHLPHYGHPGLLQPILGSALGRLHELLNLRVEAHNNNTEAEEPALPWAS